MDYSFVTLKLVVSAVHLKNSRNAHTTNGYIEEMINGQKVIKSFCHEEEAKKRLITITKNCAKIQPQHTPLQIHLCQLQI